jgi:hypothetical protein
VLAAEHCSTKHRKNKNKQNGTLPLTTDT